MRHEEAAAAGMVEKYLLHELNPLERDAFEEHYFCCGLCAADLQAAADIVAVLRESRPPAAAERQLIPWPRISVWLSAAAGFLLCLVGARVLPFASTSGRPYIPSATAMLHMGSRAETEAASYPLRDTSLLLYIDIPAENQWTGYEIRIQPSSGGKKYNLSVSPTQARDSIPIVFPKNSLPAGAYNLEVFGVANGQSQRLQSQSIRIQ
jgi:hypothetical protein